MHQSDLMLPDMNYLQGTIYVSVCCQMFLSGFLGSVDSGPVLKQRIRVQGVMAASRLTEQEAERSWLWDISLKPGGTSRVSTSLQRHTLSNLPF